MDQFVIQNGTLLFTGIRIASGNNTIRKNTIRGFGQGIHLLSSQNTVAWNNITENGRIGIVLEGSSNNHIEKNIVTKNTVGITLDEYSRVSPTAV